MDILLVDDHGPTREEMMNLIEEHDDLNVIGQAATGEEGLRQVQQLHPDLVLMDVVMPGMNGIEATRAIRGSDPGVRVLALSNHTGRNLVKALIEAGAAGYVRKDHAYEELILAIRTVAGGHPYLGAQVEE